MKICLITNKQKDIDYAHTSIIEKIMDDMGIAHYRGEKATPGEFYTYTNPETIDLDTDMILVIGGDGTIINTAIDLLKIDIPIIAFNRGTLGYLAQIEVNEIEDVLKRLVNGKYSIEKRMMLKGMSEKETIFYPALNDAVIKNDEPLRSIDLNLYINDEFVSKYTADGLIISTPTGSTAYNISAGGPIIKPDASLFSITPICAHTLFNQSLVIDGNDKIEIEIATGKYNTVITASVFYDGKARQQLKTGERLKITKSEYTTSLVKIKEHSFIEILSRKIGK